MTSRIKFLEKRIENFERNYVNKRDVKDLAIHIDTFKSNMATIAASLPFDQWPSQFKVAFVAAFDNTENLRELYLSLLPKQ